VHVDGDYTETVYHDGTRVTAVPEASDSYLEKARKYGYGTDTGALSREHEILHTFLAERLWGHGSHALWAVAHDQQEGGVVAPVWVQEEEESLVLAFQVYLNGGAADPVALKPLQDAGLDREGLRAEAFALLREQ